MQAWQIEQFGVEHLKWRDLGDPLPGANQVVMAVKAASLNYRDWLVVQGKYNPKLPLPATPLSDAAGVITAVGPDVDTVKVGDEVVTHFIADWQDGPVREEYRRSTLGCPGPGVAGTRVVLPAKAVVAKPPSLTMEEAATLPIAALTAWSVLVNEAGMTEVNAAQRTVLTLGTGGVSIFALQLAKALGCTLFITSGSDAKLARAKQLGADVGINYKSTPDWAAEVLALTQKTGVDVVVDTVGSATLAQSLKAAKMGGMVAVLGALSGLETPLNTAAIMMRRIRLQGIFVDSRRSFEQMNAFIERKRLRPIIDRVFPLAQLPDALRWMESGQHFGKIVLQAPET